MQYLYGDTRSRALPIASNEGLTVGAPVALDGGNVTPASAWTWDTDKDTTRAAFVEAFAGISGQFKDSSKNFIYGNGSTLRAVVACSGTFKSTYTGTAPAVSEYVGPAKAAGNALRDDLVEKVSSLAQAIGVVVAVDTATSTVEVEVLSTLFPAAR